MIGLLYKVGTLRELSTLDLPLPKYVIARVAECLSILDDAYGANRDYSKQGGFVVIAEDYDDMLSVKELVDYENQPYEWIDKISDYIIALYLLADDFGIVVAMPAKIAPNTILQEPKGDFYYESN